MVLCRIASDITLGQTNASRIVRASLGSSREIAQADMHSPGHMAGKRHYLIIKHGALGDVVRTSYFARALDEKFSRDLRLSWLTSPRAESILKHNHCIDDVWTKFDSAARFVFDRIFCLEEEPAIVEAAAALRAKAITGAIAGREGSVTYTADSAAWFDMSAISRLGRDSADDLKKENRRGHAEIFMDIFQVSDVQPHLPGMPPPYEAVRAWRRTAPTLIGINPSAGPRWRSKVLPETELRYLVKHLAEIAPGRGIGIVLLGAGPERQRNLQLASDLGSDRVFVPDTDASVIRFAAIVGALDYMISSDSLGLHLAIAQRIPFLAFFAPTSAAEIDDFGLGTKVVSTAADYCSYRSDADNRSITASRIIAAAESHRPEFFLPGQPVRERR